MLALLSALVLAAPPATHPPHAEWASEDAVANEVAKLFSGARTASVKQFPKELIVGPIKRNGLWGYARDFRGAVAGGVGFAAFTLKLVDLGKEKRPQTAQQAVDEVERAGAVHLVVALIALDGAHKVIGKPAGWPLESDVDTGCVGDLCARSFAAVEKLTVLDPKRAVVGVVYVSEMTSKYAVVAVVKATVQGSKPLVLGYTDDLTGCERSASARSHLEGCKVMTTLEQHCDLKSDACEGLCVGYSKHGLKVSILPALDDICGK